MNQDDQFKKQMDEYKKNPAGNFSDSVNRSITGDVNALTGGGCLTKIAMLAIIAGIILGLSYCSI